MDKFLSIMSESVFEIITSSGFLLLVFFVLAGYGAFEFILHKRVSRSEILSPEDALGINIDSKKHLQELENIKHKMDTSSGPIKLDAIQTLYIARHWDEYNLLGDEDGKIVFQNLKEVQEEINGKVVVENNSIEVQPKQNFQTTQTELLANGTLRVYTENGYTDYNPKTRLLVNAKCYSDEEKKATIKN